MDFNRTELRALLLGTGLLLLGAAARLGLAPRPIDMEWTRGTADDSARGALAVTRAEVEARLREQELASRPLQAGERLDPNTAGRIELQRLPGIGPARAAAIVAEREADGPFRDLEDLTRVPGIGPATVAALAPVLTLRDRVGSRAGSSDPRSDRRPHRIDVNRAQIKELEQITGIGPALATRIVEVRRREGRFTGPEDLLRVPGIGPRILRRIRGEVRF